MDRQRVIANLQWFLLGLIIVAVLISVTTAILLARAGAPLDFLVVLALLPGLLVMTLGSGILLAWIRLPRR